MEADTIRLVLEVAGVVFGFGVIYGEIKAIRKDISRLEEKQDKYNNLQERTRVLEVKVEVLENAHKVD